MDNYFSNNRKDNKSQKRIEDNQAQLKEFLLELEEIYKGYYTPFSKLFFSFKQFDLVLFDDFINQLAYLSINDPGDEATLYLYKSFLRTTLSFLLLNCNPSDWHLKSIVKIVNLFSAETARSGWKELHFTDTAYAHLCEIDDSESGSELYKIFIASEPVFEKLFNENIEKCCINMPTDISNGICRYVDKNIPNLLTDEEILVKATDTFRTASYYAKKDMGLIGIFRRSEM